MARCWGLDSPVTLGNLRGLQESSGSPAQNVVIHLLSEQQGHSESCQCMLWGNRVATAELSGGAWKQIAVNVVCRDNILKHFSWTSARCDSKTSWWLPLKASHVKMILNVVLSECCSGLGSENERLRQDIDGLRSHLQEAPSPWKWEWQWLSSWILYSFYSQLKDLKTKIIKFPGCMIFWFQSGGCCLHLQRPWELW